MSFSQQIRKFGEGTGNRLQQIRRGVIISLFNSAIRDTPVDTGRARANWRVSEGDPELKEIDRTDKTGEISKGEVFALVTKSEGDKPVFLANNLPYAEPLENGYSKQAPEGMMRKNVARFNQLVRVEVAK